MRKRVIVVLLLCLPAAVPFVAGVAGIAVPDQEKRLFGGYTWAGLAIIGLVISSVRAWQYVSGVRLRWFWAGAALWTVGVAFKFIYAGFLYEPVLAVAKAGLSRVGYLILGSLYAGLLTGIFEGGLTAAAGLIWRKLSQEARRAVAVGIGAGAVEAFWIGAVLLLTILAAHSDVSTRREVLSSWREGTAITAVPWLVPPVERLIALLGHTSSRALILLAVATRRWRYFWYGFLLLTSVDALATYFDLTGQVNTISTWWIELALSPFAIISIPIIAWCLRRWPPSAAVATPRARHVDVPDFQI